MGVERFFNIKHGGQAFILHTFCRETQMQMEMPNGVEPRELIEGRGVMEDGEGHQLREAPGCYEALLGVETDNTAFEYCCFWNVPFCEWMS
jgi:hypothetical protein